MAQLSEKIHFSSSCKKHRFILDTGTGQITTQVNKIYYSAYVKDSVLFPDECIDKTTIIQFFKNELIYNAQLYKKDEQLYISYKCDTSNIKIILYLQHESRLLQEVPKKSAPMTRKAPVEIKQHDSISGETCIQLKSSIRAMQEKINSLNEVNSTNEKTIKALNEQVESMNKKLLERIEHIKGLTDAYKKQIVQYNNIVAILGNKNEKIDLLTTALKSQEEWTCINCTLVNNRELTHCTACASSRLYT
jgi:hypothetical protein